VDELDSLAVVARDGDRRALGRLIRLTQVDVYRLCDRLGPSGQAEDLTQESYIQMMRCLPQFRGESSFRTWLLSIARNVCANALRRRNRRDLISLHSKFRSTLAVNADFDSSVDVRNLFNQLHPQRREAFVLTQIIGLSYEETASVCDVAVGTIRSRVARARTQLIEMLNADERSLSEGYAR
jgi:RNA polymerase sigma-70 factor, ECF subfamily